MVDDFLSRDVVQSEVEVSGDDDVIVVEDAEPVGVVVGKVEMLLVEDGSEVDDALRLLR